MCTRFSNSNSVVIQWEFNKLSNGKYHIRTKTTSEYAWCEDFPEHSQQVGVHSREREWKLKSVRGLDTYTYAVTHAVRSLTSVARATQDFTRYR